MKNTIAYDDGLSIDIDRQEESTLECDICFSTKLIELQFYKQGRESVKLWYCTTCGQFGNRQAHFRVYNKTHRRFHYFDSIIDVFRYIKLEGIPDNLYFIQSSIYGGWKHWNEEEGK